MRNIRWAILGLCVALVCLPAFPAAGAANPTTRPATQEGKILVLPFVALNQSKYQQWLGRSIQQSLLADLTSLAPGRMLSANRQAPDLSTALSIAQGSDAQYIVDGSFVVSGEALRVTGQVIDVARGQAIAGIKATGPAMQIFRLEDQLAMQIRHALALGPLVAPNPAPPPPQAQPQPQEQYGALSLQPPPPADAYSQVYAAQPYSPALQNDYDAYYYGNPYIYGGFDAGYGLGWPAWGWGGGIIVTSPGFGHGFHHGRFGRSGFGHGGFGHGGGRGAGGFHGGGHAGGHR